MSSSFNGSYSETGFDMASADGAVAFISDYDGVFAEEVDLDGVDPNAATEAKPGSEDKVLMLAARYAAGLPLWHQSDCYDHGPEMLEKEDDKDDSVELDFLDDEEES